MYGVIQATRWAREAVIPVLNAGDGRKPDTMSAEDALKRKGDRLAKILRKRRMKHGAISFDKVEVKFNLNRDNEPVGVYFKESKDANKLIEESPDIPEPVGIIPAILSSYCPDLF